MLHGQRRIGKSSIIRNIPKKSQDLDDFVFISFDLEDYSQEPLSGILAALAEKIVEDIQLEQDHIKLPKSTELEVIPDIFYNQFLSQVYQKLEGKNLVLLLDEFEALSNENSESSLEEFFKYLSAIINLDDKLYLILFIGQELLNTQNIIQIFNDVPIIQEIGLLNKISTENLITKPAQGVLSYEKDAIEAIFKLSAGHPYFTQVICFAIFVRAREKEAFNVSKEDVEAVIDKAIELGEASLAWFWDGFSIPEKVLFSAVAEAQENAGNPSKLLKSYSIDEKDSRIKQAIKKLGDNGFLDDTRQRIKIELVRRWIIQRHPLREEIGELDKIEQKKNHNKGEITIYSNNNVNDSHVLSTTHNIAINNSAKFDFTIFNTIFKTIDIFKNNSTKSKFFILTAILPILGISIIILRGDQFFRTCPVGQQKNLGFFCIADTNRISRGDRTFFPNITNIFRDQAIAAFKQGNYQQAVELFDKAVAANRSDPEVLIYSNNARALQQGSPLTLAVAVPADNRTGNAQEMLRGVAQAQNQFNKNNGFSGRLLEIVIANDSNDPEKAKQIAQELIKDQSILAVIGHNYSEVTQAVLPEYGQAKLAVISPTSTSIFLQNPVFFRAVVSDAAAGQKLAEYTYKNLKLKKVVIFANPKSSYISALRNLFATYFVGLGGEVVRPPMIDLTLNTFDAEKEVPSSLSKYGAEAAMLFPDVKYTEIAINIAKVNQLLKNNPSNTQKRALKLIGENSLYSEETLRGGGKDVEGLILSVPWFRGTQKAELFAQQAQQQWGGEISWRTATSYDATKALIKSLSSNASRNTVLENLQNVTLSSNETSGYGLQFTPQRERQGEPILVKVEKGKFIISD
ncbi:ABC transporter substrate-binding protein [Aulosira sp. FACHB-615]|nr:ABC transporter substrate-binding protein [Aulosira sp. FACHB-615]